MLTSGFSMTLSLEARGLWDYEASHMPPSSIALVINTYLEMSRN